MKQQRYWNNQLHKYMEERQEEGGEVVLRIASVDYHKKLWNQALTFIMLVEK
jgi:hypothetical protein